jgi:Dolichyl-phosphate-mannose-protein mannosyltransferase
MDAHSQRVGATLFALVLAIYVFTAGGSLTTTDAVVAFEVTRQLVDRQSVALPRDMLGNEAHHGRDGRYYSPFGITQSVFNVPFFLAGRAAARVTGLAIGRADAIEKAAVALGNTVAMAIGAWVCFLFARLVTGSTRTAASCALATAFVTPLWPYSKFGFNAPLALLFVTLALYCAWSVARSEHPANPAWIGWWLGLALLTRHELPILLLPIVFWLYLESSDAVQFVRRTAAVLLGFLPAVAGWCAFNV